jgi:hypothetical protein
VEVKSTDEEPFTLEDLQRVWNDFAEQRKLFQAEYQLLQQPFDRKENEITIHLHNPVQETILNTLKGDMITFLRQNLQNKSIMISGELREEETRKIIYTNREKFAYLLEKNPVLKELKERLGLDTDF